MHISLVCNIPHTLAVFYTIKCVLVQRRVYSCPVNSYYVISTLMWWWTTLFAVPTAVQSSPAEDVFIWDRPSLWCEQGGQPGVQERLSIWCSVIGLFVQLRAERVWPSDRGTECWKQNLWLGPEPHSALDKGVSSVVLPRALFVCPLRPCREIGLCNRMLATRGMKSLSVDGPWCVGVPGSSWAKSESKQMSLFRGSILWGWSSRDVSESLRRRLYLVRFSMPVKDEKESVTIRYEAQWFSLYAFGDKSEELPGKSCFCDLNLGKLCSLILRKLEKGEHLDK